MKSQKISYKIQRQGFEKILEITVDIVEIESHGLQDYLYQNGLIDNDNNYTVLSRFIIISPKEEKSKKNYQQRPSHPKYFKYRVDLHSNEYFKNETDVQRYVDVVASTKGKALMIAMNKVGFRKFPENWGNMEVLIEKQIEDFGIYSLDDTRNTFFVKKEKEFDKHYH